jgi:hypothetical protein
MYDAGMYCDECEFQLKEDPNTYAQAEQDFTEKQRTYDELADGIAHHIDSIVEMMKVGNTKGAFKMLENWQKCWIENQALDPYLEGNQVKQKQRRNKKMKKLFIYQTDDSSFLAGTNTTNNELHGLTGMLSEM